MTSRCIAVMFLLMCYAKGSYSELPGCVKACKDANLLGAALGNCIGSCMQANCNKHPCDNFHCQNGGTCSVSLTTGQAVCNCFGDYSGLHCEVSPCAPQLCPFCFHGGTCTVNANGQATCQCAGDLTGDRCSTTPCVAGYDCGTGTCYLNNRRAACACPAGYTGTHCEIGPCDYDAGLNQYLNCPS